MHRMTTTIALLVLTTLLAGCLIVPPHVPPGQIKKQSAPGQMKKH
jgi:hypothetical protein